MSSLAQFRHHEDPVFLASSFRPPPAMSLPRAISLTDAAAAGAGPAGAAAAAAAGSAGAAAATGAGSAGAAAGFIGPPGGGLTPACTPGARNVRLFATAALVLPA